MRIITRKLLVPTMLLFVMTAEAVAPSVIGKAVYYSNRMNGRATAMKGEKYDKNAMTAATHKAFPLGRMVKVTNLQNHKSVVVRVTDRMSPRSKAVIDLSHSAAEQLDIIHAGHARVRVDLLAKQ